MNTVANQNGENIELDCQKVDKTRKTNDEHQKLDAKQTGRKNDGPSLARKNSVSKQNEENRILVHQNSVSKQNEENKGMIECTGPSQLKQKNGYESENYQQQCPSNIRVRSNRNSKKTKHGKLPKKKAKFTFKPMFNLSYDSNGRKMHNKERTLALKSLNEDSNPDMTVNVQKQSTELNKEDQIGAFTNKAQSNTNSNKQEKLITMRYPCLPKI